MPTVTGAGSEGPVLWLYGNYLIVIKLERVVMLSKACAQTRFMLL